MRPERKRKKNSPSCAHVFLETLKFDYFTSVPCRGRRIGSLGVHGFLRVISASACASNLSKTKRKYDRVSLLIKLNFKKRYKDSYLEYLEYINGPVDFFYRLLKTTFRSYPTDRPM